MQDINEQLQTIGRVIQNERDQRENTVSELEA